MATAANAITVTKVEKNIFGTWRSASCRVLFDSSYPTGGESLAAEKLGMHRVMFAIAVPDTTVAAGYGFHYDTANEKLQAFLPTAAVDIAAFTITDTLTAFSFDETLSAFSFNDTLAAFTVLDSLSGDAETTTIYIPAQTEVNYIGAQTNKVNVPAQTLTAYVNPTSTSATFTRAEVSDEGNIATIRCRLIAFGY